MRFPVCICYSTYYIVQANLHLRIFHCSKLTQMTLLMCFLLAPFAAYLEFPFILCFLCKLYQLDINRRERIRKKELESSPGLTRNQPKFNLLNCQDNFQDQNGFHKNHNEFPSRSKMDFIKTKILQY